MINGFVDTRPIRPDIRERFERIKQRAIQRDNDFQREAESFLDRYPETWRTRRKTWGSQQARQGRYKLSPFKINPRRARQAYALAIAKSTPGADAQKLTNTATLKTLNLLQAISLLDGPPTRRKKPTTNKS
jgi:hypothetical protein